MVKNIDFFFKQASATDGRTDTPCYRDARTHLKNLKIDELMNWWNDEEEDDKDENEDEAEENDDDEEDHDEKDSEDEENNEEENDEEEDNEEDDEKGV